MAILTKSNQYSHPCTLNKFSSTTQNWYSCVHRFTIIPIPFLRTSARAIISQFSRICRYLLIFSGEALLIYTILSQILNVPNRHNSGKLYDPKAQYLCCQSQFCLSLRKHTALSFLLICIVLQKILKSISNNK